MWRSLSQPSFVGLVLVSIAAPGVSLAANNHVIEATGDLTWRSNGQESTTDGDPLVVDVAAGDTIEVQVGEGVPHGFMTIDKAGNSSPPPASAPNLVIACGEAPEAKPDAILREVECNGTSSQLDDPFKGTLKLQVLDAFSAETNFWCTVHTSIMWGVLK